MTALSTPELRLITELEHELRTISPDGGTPFDCVLAELRTSLQAQNTVIVKMRQTQTAWDVDFFHLAGSPSRALVGRVMKKFFNSAPPRFAWYNAASPEPAERNRVVESTSRIPAGEYESSRIYSELMVPLRLERHKQLRALLCDGPALLAWFGAFIPDRVDARQFEIFRRIVPSLRDRLALEQRLREGPSKSAALEVALDHLGAPAFVLGRRGEIRDLNAAGRALMTMSSPADVTNGLRDLAARRASKLTGELVPLRKHDRLLGWLAIIRGPGSTEPAWRRMRTETYAARWRLSPRQREVFTLLASGASNLRIGCELGISERTVEDHVAAILTKAQVGTRAALIAELIG